MRIRSFILSTAALLLFSFTSNANITGLSYADDHDGAIVCTPYSGTGGDTMNIYGDQYWGPAHVLGEIYTDTELDPTLTIASGIDNDTSFAWTDYHVNIYMAQNFSIVSGSVSVYNPLAGDWTAATPIQPVWNGSQYVGTLNFYAGTPVAIGGELDFSYAIHFVGSTQYSFTQEMTPTPEPGTLSLVLFGALLLGGRIAAKRR